MPNRYGRFNWLIRLAKIATAISLAAMAVAFVLTIAYGILDHANNGENLRTAVYLLACLAEVALAAAIIVAYGSVLARVGSYSGLAALNGQMRRLQSVLQASQEQLKVLTDLGSLSDQAKAMIYHDREIEAVQEVVHAYLVRQDYAQAESVIGRMEAQLGYHEEAQRLREAIAANRDATREGKIAAAVDRVNQIIEQKNWARAQREAQRLSDAFPDNKRVAALNSRILDQQNQHKRDLLRQYDQAVKRNDVDRSIELLKRLDGYLTAPEAAAMEESARGVFRAKLHNLGVQFAIAVTEERWEQAVASGVDIIREFPKSRMAEEVRQKLEALKHLANNSVATP